MEPRSLLRVEGLVVLAIALAGYVTAGGPLWLLLVLALAPDVSMLGYLVGPRVGSVTYNAVHTYTLPLCLVAVGVWADVQVAFLIALVWAGHIGADRCAGYGLKFPSGFRETHLSARSAPVAAPTESE